MSDSDALNPTETRNPAPTGPESGSPHDTVPPPLPSRDDSAGDGPFTLETALLGPLPVPAGAARVVELDELSRRAAVYATRARGEGTRRA